MTATIDLEKYQLPPGFTVPAKPKTRPPRHGHGERFLRGPIPWPWLERAMWLPGKALHLAIVLWQQAGWRKSRTVKLCLRGQLPAGLNRQSARRAVHALETAGLVNVSRKPGHGLEVTILEYHPVEANGEA